MIPVSIIRHPKEKLSKCSLEPLKHRSELTFHKAGPDFSIDATDHIVLRLDAPVLSPKDYGHPLILLDSTWRLLPQLESCLTGAPIYRSLPADIVTAYPRVSKISEDPSRGLASVEALYLAKRLLGEDDPTLLDNYYWKDAFLDNLSRCQSIS